LKREFKKWGGIGGDFGTKRRSRSGLVLPRRKKPGSLRRISNPSRSGWRTVFILSSLRGTRKEISGEVLQLPEALRRTRRESDTKQRRRR